jgi:hypothetical protein
MLVGDRIFWGLLLLCLGWSVFVDLRVEYEKTSSIGILIVRTFLK